MKPKRKKALLDLNALFSGDTAAAFPVKTTPKPRTAAANLADRKAGIDPATPVTRLYEATELLLPILETVCTECQTRHHTPFGPPLVREENPRRGSHTRPMHRSPYSDDHNLPRRFLYTHVEVPMCSVCFDMADRILEAFIDNGQLELF